MTTHESSEPRPSIPDLLKKCQDLCGHVGKASEGLGSDKESFLRGSLGDALQQLELILRVLDGESKSATWEESQGLLRRIFARRSEEDAEGLPELESPRQGLQGNSWTISLSELLGFLAYGRKTGVLWVDALEENYMLVLEEGQLLHATSDQTPAGLRLGEVLVGFGFLTRRQLERFLASREGGHKLIAGEDLIKTGMISEEELINALTYQVQQLFFRLIGTQNAVFRFREGMEVLLAHKVRLDINQLLLQTAAAHDEEAEGVKAGLEMLTGVEGQDPASQREDTDAPRGDADGAHVSSAGDGSQDRAPGEPGSQVEDDGAPGSRKPGKRH